MSKTYNLTEKQLNFLADMKERTSSAASLRRRYAACVKKMYADTRGVKAQEYNIDTIRLKHNPALTAEFLSLFGSPDGLKFLTHDFDPGADVTMEEVRKRAEKILLSDKFSYQLPKSLIQLFKGFLNGPSWLDSHGDRHNLHLDSEEFRAWASNNSGFHPITSSEFGSEIQTFRDTVRVSKPKLPLILADVVSKVANAKKMRIKEVKLDKADFYTNVFILSRILYAVLFDMAQRNISLPVNVVYERDEWDEYRLHQIKITHVESEANPFEDVRKKLTAQGGALYKLLRLCQSYCDWTVEANFEGECKRWRILDSRGLPETECLKTEEVEGFTHIFTFFKYN